MDPEARVRVQGGLAELDENLIQVLLLESFCFRVPVQSLPKSYDRVHKLRRAIGVEPLRGPPRYRQTNLSRVTTVFVDRRLDVGVNHVWVLGVKVSEIVGRQQ